MHKAVKGLSLAEMQLNSHYECLFSEHHSNVYPRVRTIHVVHPLVELLFLCEMNLLSLWRVPFGAPSAVLWPGTIFRIQADHAILLPLVKKGALSTLGTLLLHCKLTLA